jgi:hypothetical protein
LGESGDSGSLGKASVLHNQVKERQFKRERKNYGRKN